MSHIVFWQNIPSYHQSALIRALADSEGYSVTLVTESDVPEWRKDMGWSAPDFGKAQVVVSPTEAVVQSLAKETEDGVHILSGIGAYQFVDLAFQRLRNPGATIGIYSEPVSQRGIKGLLRRGRGSFQRLRYDRTIDFILATGNLGVQWFEACGYEQEKIFPFGYFLDRLQYFDIAEPVVTTTNSREQQQEYRIIFIGQLIRRKGVDLLLHALSGKGLKENWRLDIVGDGPQRGQLEALTDELGIASHTSFRGVLSNMHAMDMLSKADLLVLPSRWDGWGAVVNEALMRGVPVVCSDRCGSADLVRSASRGAVFQSGSVSSLAEKLRQRIELGSLTEAERSAIRDWSKCIEGKLAASYLHAVIKWVHGGGCRPRPSWLEM